MKKNDVKYYENGLRIPLCERIEGLHYYDLICEGGYSSNDLLRKHGWANHVATWIADTKIEELEGDSFGELVSDLQKKYNFILVDSLEELKKNKKDGKRKC